MDAVDNARVKAASLFDFDSPPMPFSLSLVIGTTESTTKPIIPGEQTVTATVGVVYETG